MTKDILCQLIPVSGQYAEIMDELSTELQCSYKGVVQQALRAYHHLMIPNKEEIPDCATGLLEEVRE